MNLTKICTVCSILYFLFFIPPGNSQALLNGDFENHNFTDCAFNLENVDFNANMPSVTAFGNNSEVDIQTNGCGFFPTISNDWYISLSQRPSGEYDQISIEINQPLTEGNTYQLSYYELADTSSNPFQFNSNMPIEIGLSYDPSNFGDSIYSSLPVPDVWTLCTHEFVAPNGGQHITIRMAGTPGLRGWNFLDGFKLSPLTDVEEAKSMEIKIYPNPVLDWVNIETDMPIRSIRIFNAVGQLVCAIDQAGDFYSRINFSGMSAGVYFLEITNENNRLVKRVEKI